jgi:hypothetical protein
MKPSPRDSDAQRAGLPLLSCTAEVTDGPYHARGCRTSFACVRSRVFATAVWVIAVAAANSGCGAAGNAPSDARHKTLTAVAGGAPISAGPSAPHYCRLLVSSQPLRDLGTTLDQLAIHPHNASPRASMRLAASALDAAAAQTSGERATALHQAANAARSIATHGITAAREFDHAIRRAGRLLEGPCAFPVG